MVKTVNNKESVAGACISCLSIYSADQFNIYVYYLLKIIQFDWLSAVNEIVIFVRELPKFGVMTSSYRILKTHTTL